MPKIIEKKLKYRSKIFDIFDLKLEFGNGKIMDYEVLYDETIWTAMIVPVDEKGNVYLINEYQASIDQYLLSLPKGGVNYHSDAHHSKDPAQAAQRELEEEIGFEANRLIPLVNLTSSAGSINKATAVFIALDLKHHKLKGDEPEELEMIPYPLAQFEKLIADNKLSDARVIAALFLARQYIKNHNLLKL